MRSGYSKDELLLAAAKKKPRLQALVDQVTTMTNEEITALSEPLWIKQALSTLKLSGGKGQKERMNDLIQRTKDAEDAARNIPDTTYEVRIWDSVDQFIGQDRTSGSHEWKIEVQTGDSLMIVDEELVRFGDSVIRVDTWNRTPLLHGSKFVGYMSLNNYRGFHRALLARKHKV